MSPISRRFVAELDRFIARHRLPVVLFRKGQRKDDVMAERLRAFRLKEGVVFVGKAQEKAPVCGTEKRHSPRTGRPYPWIVKSTAMVTHYYIYAVDDDFGPFFLKGSVRIFVYAEPRSIVLSPQRAEGSKRSPNRMANCPIATVHSIGLCQ